MLDVIPHPMPEAAETPLRESLDRAAIRGVLRSLMPALDGAFGLDRCEPFPHAIDGLVAALHAGPLGPAPERRAALKRANALRRLRAERLA
ncbi:hypothetical protein [Methylobacterium soli]|uniref:Uncharacterized protein n=1 Tax=Methylobacterium soli TaxID=553447 RepID=A0A6L3T1P8_9HYPH|nr:hypothetical protein [Methylobacterium soli]KAB1078597.1 hypothetical protein F6X53_14475 [Methylobacterium soli]GJE46181.1 hypothetical protein AEGHOMDF_5381 [Methylobacterium soli]